MKEVKQRPACHRAEDLVTYLYGEFTEAEAQDFNSHLRQCDACRSEFAVFNQVHDSIVMWRNEALGAAFDPRAVAIDSSLESNQFVRHERKLSALAAIREFFTVSPMWLRGATAFAALLLFVLGIFMVVRFSQKPAEVVQTSNTEQMYTRQQVQAEINRAVELTKANIAKQSAPTPTVPTTAQKVAPNQSQLAVNHQTRSTRLRGLSREEREQLAADLRLTNSTEEDELQLMLPDQEQERPN